VTLPLIQFENVNKWFGNFHSLRDINLQVHRGERIVICGPSGSGKSTLLRCINRLEEHQEGKLTVMGIELTDDLKAIERIRRQVGMVFQQFNLFPHLSVLDNLTLAPIWVEKNQSYASARTRYATARACAYCGASAQVSFATLRRSAATGSDCTRLVSHATDFVI